MSTQEEQKQYCWGEFIGSLPAILRRLKRLKKFKMVGFYWIVEELSNDEGQAKHDAYDAYFGLRNKSILTKFVDNEPYYQVLIYGNKMRTNAKQKVAQPSQSTPVPATPDYYVVVSDNHSMMSYDTAVAVANSMIDSKVWVCKVDKFVDTTVSEEEKLSAAIKEEMARLAVDDDKNYTLLIALMTKSNAVKLCTGVT